MKTHKGLGAWLLESLFALAGVLVVGGAKLLFKVLRLLTLTMARYRRSTAGVLAMGGAAFLVGWVPIAWALGIALVATSCWRAAHRESFDRLLGAWCRTWWRRWTVYRRTWDKTMTACGLAVKGAGEKHTDAVPVLRTVQTTPYWDRLTVQLRTGHEVADLRKASEKLRHAFDAERSAVKEIEPKLVRLDFMRRDPLRFEPIRPAAIPRTVEAVDLTAVPVGVDEHLEPVHVSLVGGHTVASGAPGAGKASLYRNTFRQIVPLVAAGLCKPVLIDPKGQELRQVADFADEVDYMVDPDHTVTRLRELVDEMREAGKTLGLGGESDHQPTTEHPLRLVVVDELAALLNYWPRSVRDKCEEALGAIAAMGRSSGYIVMGCIQEPTKDVFRLRDLFMRRFGLALPSKAFTEAALADDAVDRGALCHEIGEDMPGTAYMLAPSSKSATRMRFAHVDNDGLAEAVKALAELRAEQAAALMPAATVTELDARRARGEAA